MSTHSKIFRYHLPVRFILKQFFSYKVKQFKKLNKKAKKKIRKVFKEKLTVHPGE
jgi:hypothetical protein